MGRDTNIEKDTEIDVSMGTDIAIPYLVESWGQGFLSALITVAFPASWTYLFWVRCPPMLTWCLEIPLTWLYTPVELPSPVFCLSSPLHLKILENPKAGP